MTLKFCLGVFLGIISFCGFALNLFVLYAVVALVCQRKSSTYIISSANIFCDSIQLFLVIAYLVPSILLDSWLFEGGKENIYVQSIGTVFVFCWYFSAITQILMAVTRLIAVCFPSSNFFTYRNASIIVLALFPATLLLTLVAQYLTPCCKITHDHTVLSISYSTESGVPNYINMYIDAPLDFLSSVTCIGCYIYIVVYMRRMKRDYQISSEGNKSLLMEYKYALQFFAISIFFLAAWLCFRVFPFFIDKEKREFFIIVSTCMSVNCSANAAVYITSNSEVRHALKLGSHNKGKKTASIIFTTNPASTNAKNMKSGNSVLHYCIIWRM